MKDNRYSLRALALLLGYPNAELRAKLTGLMEAIETEGRSDQQHDEQRYPGDNCRAPSAHGNEAVIGLVGCLHVVARSHGRFLFQIRLSKAVSGCCIQPLTALGSSLKPLRKRSGVPPVT